MHDLFENLPPADLDAAAYDAQRARAAVVTAHFLHGEDNATIRETLAALDVIGPAKTYLTGMPTGMLRPGISPTAGSGAAWQS